jgi:hypothetical protein
MNLITTMTTRLDQARSLAGILAAGYEAFEFMLPVLEAHQDPEGGAFTTFVMAATYAVGGRDALLFAPSLPHSRNSQPDGHDAPGTALETAIALARLSQLLAARLGHAAALAASAADRRACAGGAFQASTLAALLCAAAG